jgi:hypothetical protein
MQAGVKKNASKVLSLGLILAMRKLDSNSRNKRYTEITGKN